MVATLFDRWVDYRRLALISEAALADTQVVSAKSAVAAAFLSLAFLVFGPLDSWTTATAT